MLAVYVKSEILKYKVIFLNSSIHSDSILIFYFLFLPVTDSDLIVPQLYHDENKICWKKELYSN